MLSEIQEQESIIIEKWQIKSIKEVKIPYTHKEVVFFNYSNLECRGEVLQEVRGNFMVFIYK